MPNIVPLGNRILVLPDAPKELKRGRLYIPEIAQSKPQEGIIVAIGHTVQSLKIGDRILFGRYAGSEIQSGDVAYLIVREPDVMGILPAEISK